MRRLFNLPWDILLAVFIGFGLSLVYSWLISPVEYVDADPSLLYSDFKDEYRAAIAAAYASNGDLDRARSRLAVLGDSDVIQELSAQAQQMLAAGEPFEQVSQVAQLASDIQIAGSGPQVITTTHATIQSQLTITADSALNITSTPIFEITSVTTALETPGSFATATARPTHTATMTPGLAFALVAQDPLCEPDSSRNLLEVVVMDGRRRQIPGVEIIVTWNGGEDRFYTGFKPELGNGYADFQMADAVSYNVRAVDGGVQVTNVIAPPCSKPNGETYTGNLRLTFQQP